MGKRTSDSAGAAAALRRVRIHDVAKKCGLSITTVSQALNLRSDQCRVSGETRTMVKRVASELGYRPSRVARGLAKGRSFTVAILAWSVTPSGIYTEMISVISQVLEKQGYHLILAPITEQHDQWAQTLLDEQVDGCVVLNNVTSELRDVLQRSRVPAVLVNVESDVPVRQVLVDDIAGMREITQHLFSLGHRRITYLNDNETAEMKLPPSRRHCSLRDREISFLSEMNAAGCAELATVANLSGDLFAAQFAATPIAERPTAVICFWHRLGMRLMRALWQRGINVPSDVSVATFNDVEGIDDAIPPLTTVAIPNEEMGRAAATLLLEQIDALAGGDLSATRPQQGNRLVLRPKLVIRQSTAFPRNPFGGSTS